MKSSNVIRSFALVLAIAAGQFSLQVAHAHAALQQSTPAAMRWWPRQARSISCSTRH